MGFFTSYSCVLFVFFCGNLMLGEISVHAAEPSGDEDLKAPWLNEDSYFPSLRLSSSFPEDVEMIDHCLKLLHDFGQRYTSLSSCLVSNARPVKMCQNCYSGYNNFLEMYTNISTQMGSGNKSCEELLLHADRLMLLYNLYKGLNDIWESAECTSCLTNKSMSNTTLYFIDRHNQSLTCFEKYSQGNYSELCVECKTSYKVLNDLYSNMSKNKSLCIDVEDAMNSTRYSWSKVYNCSLTREENVPVIAVSSFMLFLPLIFYLSNYLHSEQKKRKLMHPKRAKSSHSLMNIQDKYS
ncbi:osteopetrosis-associated transmembrane protein 1 isoform X1 [Ictalurus punctatus]|uniref:Osteopetrosis-associated transmembrane protein 1 n=2 Tax=Ictalurus punctatus TaxID=7998 RepID=W5U6X5_ICTPU|nr:osteopetrosis-associated transmembrane protein 1 isoform X1 [Ictalurus punctatus]